MSLLRFIVAVAGMAGPPPSGDALELSWTAPEECPSRAELEAMIHAQVVTVPADTEVGRLEDVVELKTAVPGEEVTSLPVSGEVLDIGR